ncbi:MAG: tetratricopeptide repeat protein [Planctomycetaceae bacterium]
MRSGTILLLAGALLGCKSAPPADPADLGRFHRRVTTSSPEAQAAFDRGLVCLFGFDHESAIESFRRAVALDPGCAMAHWGIALAAGPHINNPAMEQAAAKAAAENVEKAKALLGSATPLEVELIEALARRYAWPPPPSRASLDEAYATAMREVYRNHPRDADVGALFAESLMNLRPWDHWTAEGKAQPGTAEILSVLDSVLTISPHHPGANHYLIHALEASPFPDRALEAADRLRPTRNGTSHLVHMPAHIDLRLGRYADAEACNERAVALDRAMAAAGKGQGFYTLYRAHNLHFLAYAAMFQGRGAVAIRAGREVTAIMPAAVVDAYPDYLEGFLAAPYHVLVRFGRWEEILAEPEPGPNRPATTAFRHYARGVAFATLGRLEEAVAEQQAFLQARGAVPASASIGNNSTRVVLDIAEGMLAGELAYRQGRVDEAFALMREGVKREEALRYDEPWGWMQPVRHALGALLLEQGRAEEALLVYTADLARHPANGWALHGLAECLRTLGRLDEAAAAEQRFREAWTRADVTPPGSCFCRTG